MWAATKQTTRFRRDGDRPCKPCQDELVEVQTKYRKEQRKANQRKVTKKEVANGYDFKQKSSTIATVTHVPREMCLNVGRFAKWNDRSMAKVSAQATIHRKNVFGGKAKGMAKLAAIGSHIPHELGYGHWTASHIVAKSTRREFSDQVVTAKPISTLDPRHTTVALYVAT